MTPIPLADLRLSPRSHASAMWWLGLLYRRPQRFKEALAELPKRRQRVAAGELLLHVLPYLLVVSVVGRGLLTWVGAVPRPAAGSFFLEFVVRIAVGIAQFALGIAAGIVGGIVIEIAGGIALGRLGIAGGIGRESLEGSLEGSLRGSLCCVRRTIVAASP